MIRFILLSFLLTLSALGYAQNYTIRGKVVAQTNGAAIDYAHVTLSDNEAWAVTDEKGAFEIKNVREGNYQLKVQVLGYETSNTPVAVKENVTGLVIELKEISLKLNEVVVTAQRNDHAGTTAYGIDRTTLDHTQALNISDISSLLPGGKFRGDLNLASSDTRFALRSNGAEMGNATFGTAIEVDGVRLGNNARFDETKGADTRNVSLINIESIEVVSGIPSVEHGDLTNGLIKVNTKRGKAPFTVELSARPNTKQIALSKGFALGSRGGLLNLSAERTKSISDLVSPVTSYDRNVFSVNYSQVFNKQKNKPLTLNVSGSGNVGGYNSKSDPDAFSQTYEKRSDNAFRGSVGLNWLLNLDWITKVELTSSVNYQNKTTKTNTNKSSSSSQAAIHTTQEGYYIASLYDKDPNADITLLEPGYWYQLSYYENKPVSYQGKLKADWGRMWSEGLYNRVAVGAEMTLSGNLGRGTYYDDMRYAPTWREYNLSEQPFMSNYSAFVEDKMNIKLSENSSLDVMAGLRYDMTHIKRSEYGAVGNLSPRFNAKYTVIKNRPYWLSDLSFYAGWGKSVKLPSFEVLYPTPAYKDVLAFASGSDASGTAFYAYHTSPAGVVYNPNLKWQQSRQFEMGSELIINGTRISVSAFRNVTKNPYVSTVMYAPFSYNLTSQKQLEGCVIPSANRVYAINQQTGVVTVSDISGKYAPQVLNYDVRNTYKTNTLYTNGSDVKRYGVEFVVDFARIEALKTAVRIDGNYYHYKGVEQTLMASMPNATITMVDGSPYQYVGYYAGGAVSSNGNLSKQLNTNVTLTTHIPKIRLIVSLRMEATFLNYNRYLSETSGGQRGLILNDQNEYVGVEGDIYQGDNYVAYYPEYYTSWDNPQEKIPFLEKFLWAKENDRDLYTDLSRMVVKSNNKYYFNPRRVSSYFSANFNVTKEIGNIASITLFATNFLNNMNRVKQSWNNTETSLYGSGYIPQFYYGMSLRLKL